LALEQIFLRVIHFALSVSFHKNSIFVFIYTVLLSEGQTGDAWGKFQKGIFLLKSGRNGHENTFTYQKIETMAFLGQDPTRCKSLWITDVYNR
jgi:hypothetical protein